MATMTLKSIVPGGVVAALAAVASQDVIETAGDDRIFLHVKNGSGSSINVTINAVLTAIDVPGVGNMAISDIVVAVAAGAEKLIGPFSPAYRDGDGTVTIDYSAITTVTACAYKLQKTL